MSENGTLIECPYCNGEGIIEELIREDTTMQYDCVFCHATGKYGDYSRDAETCLCCLHGKKDSEGYQYCSLNRREFPPSLWCRKWEAVR